MTNPTSNFGWQMPTSTDLVTDLPADFEVFGQAVDTSLADLKGGTTGQVLKKNTDADMDFVWSADAAGMTNPMTTTGDTIYSSSGSTPARLEIGTTGQILTVAGGVPTWATAAAAVPNNASALTTGSQTTTSGSFTGLTTATAVTVTTGTKALVIITTEMSISVNSEQMWASWAVSGATTIAASNNYSVFTETPSTGTLPRVNTFTRGYIQTGLTAGSNTFTMQYKVGGGTGVFGNRSISVVDMGS